MKICLHLYEYIYNMYVHIYIIYTYMVRKVYIWVR